MTDTQGTKLAEMSGTGGANEATADFHRRVTPEDHTKTLRSIYGRVTSNLVFVALMTTATNMLVLAVPIYLFQISDRVLTSRSVDTLIMLTAVILGAVVLQSVLDAIRRLALMRTAVDVASRLGAPVLSAAAQASLELDSLSHQLTIH